MSVLKSERYKRPATKLVTGMVASVISSLQTTVPNNFPIPAVSAVANAPQNVTQAVARKMLAPPVFAPIAPSSARNPKEATETMGTSAVAGHPQPSDAADEVGSRDVRETGPSEVPPFSLDPP